MRCPRLGPSEHWQILCRSRVICQNCRKIPNRMSQKDKNAEWARLLQLNILAEKLDGGLPDLFGIVISVAGDGQGADGG